MRYCRLFLLIHVSASVFANSLPALVGRWRSVQTSNGGIGTLYAFHQDGTVDVSFGAEVEIPYRVAGDSLFLNDEPRPDEPQNGERPAAQKLKFSDDNHLQISEAGGKTQELTRKGSATDPTNPILGEWTTIRADLHGVEATQIFYPTGKCLLVIPFAWKHGKYIVTEGAIRIEEPSSPVIQGSFKTEGDKLTLPGDGGPSQFTRY